jgi:hypothetical protein
MAFWATGAHGRLTTVILEDSLPRFVLSTIANPRRIGLPANYIFRSCIVILSRYTSTIAQFQPLLKRQPFLVLFLHLPPRAFAVASDTVLFVISLVRCNASANHLHLKGREIHWQNWGEESARVTIMPVTAMRTPMKVNISSLDQEEWDVLRSERCVEFVCDGETGVA